MSPEWLPEPLYALVTRPLLTLRNLDVCGEANPAWKLGGAKGEHDLSEPESVCMVADLSPWFIPLWA